MKKKILYITLAAVFLLAGCGGNGSNNQPITDQSGQTQSKVESDSETANADQTIINESLDLLGKVKGEDRDVLGGGTDNYTADQEYLLGQVYQVNLLGKATEIYSNYRDEDPAVINSIGIEVGEADVAPYQELLRELLGEPVDVNENPSEGGATYTMWEKDGKQIFLYDTAGSLNIQMILPDAAAK